MLEAERKLDLVLRAMESAGFDLAFCERATVEGDREASCTGEGRWLRFVEAYRRGAPPLAAFFAGLAAPFGTYDVIDYLAVACPTLGEGFRAIGKYFRIVRPQTEWRIREEAERVTVTLWDGIRRDDWFFDEWTIGLTLRGFRTVLGDEMRLTGCRFRRPRPADGMRARVEGELGCPLEFDAESAAMEIDAELWRRSIPLANSRLKEALTEHAEELMREVEPDRIVPRIRSTLSRSLATEEPSVQMVASRLGTTARTLQRRLQEEGTSFSAVLDGVRRDLADRYLDGDRMGVSEIAFLLGYSDASAFARAYRRWNGRAPRAEPADDLLERSSQ